MSSTLAVNEGEIVCVEPAVRPYRVLHIVETLGRGATETWLLRMLAHAVTAGAPVDWTFYCILPDAGPNAPYAESLGAKVISSPVQIGSKVSFIGALRSELKNGGYDVLHCHHDLISGLYLAAAIGIPLKRRLIHVHNAGEAVLTEHPIKRRIYKPILRHVCLALSDKIVGVSNHTLEAFLAGRRRRHQRDVVHYSGVDAGPFSKAAPDRREFRLALGFDEDVNILLFAGRMVPEKNPGFAVDVLLNLRELDPRAVGIFAGSGPGEQLVLERAYDLNLADKVRVLGWRNDLPTILCCADWFILPSPEDVMEGFGLAVVEAQLAGLRLLLSKGIADDPLLPNAAFRRLALSDGPQAWAAAAAELLDTPAPSRSQAAAQLAASPMEMDHALTALLALHQ